MKKEVLLSLIGVQSEHVDTEVQENEPIEIISPATYIFKDGLHYFFYEEVEESMGGVIRNKIILKEDEYLEVIKKGATNSHMIFNVQKEHMTNYSTPFGEMMLGVTTEMLRTNVTEDRISAFVMYELTAEGETLSKCRIHMSVWEKELGLEG